MFKVQYLADDREARRLRGIPRPQGRTWITIKRARQAVAERVAASIRIEFPNALVRIVPAGV